MAPLTPMASVGFNLQNRRENPSSTPLPCNSWKWHPCGAAGKITHLSVIYLFFFYPATPNLLMPTITILIFGEEESRVPPWANAALPELSGQREGRAGSRLHRLCLSLWDGGICPASASSRSPCMSLSTWAWHRLVLPPLLLPTPQLFPPPPLFPF